MSARPLDCEDVIRHLFYYLDREQDAATMAAIERHLEHCRSCFSRAEFERRIKAWVGATGEKRASPRLRARIRRLVGSF